MRKINEILGMPLWQLTGEEYVALHAYAHTRTLNEDNGQQKIGKRVIGNQALADYASCSLSTIYKLRRAGVLDAAVVSRVGKQIVYDAEKALELAQAYLAAKEDRHER